jgi:hypothetical protein
VNEIVTTCRKTWRRLGVPRAQADAMAVELAADLASAAGDGVDPWSYVANDPKGFAAAWAEARGLVRPRRRVLTTGLAAVLGAIPGAVFGLFVAYGLSSSAFAEIFGTEVLVGENLYMAVFEPPQALLIALYALGGVIAYAGALAAAAAVLRWRLDPAAGPTVRLLAALLPAAVAAAVTASMAFAWRQDFSTQLEVVLGDALVAVTVFGASAAAIRLLALRRFTSERAPVGALSSTF